MPEIFEKKPSQAVGSPKVVIGYGLPSAPTSSYDIPPLPEQPEESIFHPVKAVEDLLSAIYALNAQVQLLVLDNQRKRTFQDRSVQIGLTIAYTVDYQERAFLYLLSGAAITLNLSSGGTLAVLANTWTNISFPRGVQLTVQGGSDASPNVVVIRACDVRIA